MRSQTFSWAWNKNTMHVGKDSLKSAKQREKWKSAKRNQNQHGLQRAVKTTYQHQAEPLDNVPLGFKNKKKYKHYLSEVKVI